MDYRRSDQQISKHRKVLQKQLAGKARNDIYQSLTKSYFEAGQHQQILTVVPDAGLYQFFRFVVDNDKNMKLSLKIRLIWGTQLSISKKLKLYWCLLAS